MYLRIVLDKSLSSPGNTNSGPKLFEIRFVVCFLRSSAKPENIMIKSGLIELKFLSNNDEINPIMWEVFPLCIRPTIKPYLGRSRPTSAVTCISIRFTSVTWVFNNSADSLRCFSGNLALHSSRNDSNDLLMAC